MAHSLLTGLNVLELGDGVSAAYCAKLLGQLGARVAKVEPPHGDRARRIGPFPGDKPHTERSALFLALNVNKYGLTVDMATDGGRQAVRSLADESDVVVENLGTGALDSLGLGYDSLSATNGGLVFASITPYGPWSARDGEAATDLTLFHESGHAHALLGPVDDPVRVPPVRAGGWQSHLAAGLAAATAVLTALYARQNTGRGSRVDVSEYEALATQLIASFAGHAYGRPGASRDRSAAGAVGAIGGVLPCNDGYVAISPREEAQWRQWLEMMGNPEWGEDERFATREAREANTPALWELLGEWTSRFSKFDVARWGQGRRIPCFPVNTAEDLFTDAHLAHREFFHELEHPVVGKLRYPGAAYRLSNEAYAASRRPAPTLGQHNSLLTRSFVREATPFRPVGTEAVTDRPPKRPGDLSHRLPLDGVRVVDMSWIIAGPTAARFLAAMGAEVIKVGSARRPDPSSRGAAFQVYNQSKLYSALNIAQPAGLALAKELIATADVVIENFAAGVIERLGLSYAVLREVRPDIIMVSSSGTGHSGPDRDYVAYGSLLQYYTGWNSVSGYPGGEPIKGGLWADPWVGMELAMVTIAALAHRAATGQGQYIDFSMAEALTASIAPALLDYQMSGKLREPMGNLDLAHSPHDLYRCAVHDEWVAIAVTSSDEWRALCRTIGRDDLAEVPIYKTVNGRRRARGSVDEAISTWTATLSAEYAARTLRNAGVPAAPSWNSLQVYEDDSLRRGGYFTPVTTGDGETRLPSGNRLAIRRRPSGKTHSRTGAGPAQRARLPAVAGRGGIGFRRHGGRGRRLLGPCGNSNQGARNAGRPGGSHHSRGYCAVRCLLRGQRRR